MKIGFKYSLAAVTLLVLGGCGGGGSDSNGLSGKLVDSPVVGAEYSCGSKQGVTASDGSFSCSTGPVTFKVGGVTLGTINSVPEDGYVTPYELAGTSRGNDTQKVKDIALFLQGLDDDGSYEDAIHIDKEQRDHLSKVDKDIHEMGHDEVINLLGESGAKHIPTDEEAKKHLDEQMKKHENEAKESHSQKDEGKEDHSQEDDSKESHSQKDKGKDEHQNDSNATKKKDDDKDHKDNSMKEKDHNKSS